MADYTLCVNKWCSLRGRCWRSKATPSKTYQSFAEFEPWVDDYDRWHCDYFIEVQDDANRVEDADT